MQIATYQPVLVLTNRMSLATIQSILTPTPNYESAQNALLVEFQRRFLPENESEFSQEEVDAIMLSIGDNSEVIKELIAKHVTPIYQKVLQENAKARNNYQEALSASIAAKNTATKESSGATNAVAGSEKKKGTRRLSTWQIYLTYASKLIPGYKESTRKIGLCKDHYKLLSEQEIKDLCDKYVQDHPGAAPLATKGQKIAAKRGGISGYSLFSREWYEEQKRLNPENRGLQAKACGQAWKDLTEDERNHYNIRAKEEKEEVLEEH